MDIFDWPLSASSWATCTPRWSSTAASNWKSPRTPPTSRTSRRLPGGLRVAWDTAALIRQIDPSWTEPTGGQRVTLAFRCPAPADVDAKYAELSALGHGHKEPWDAFWGQRYATVKDPDGNPVDLFASL